MLLARIKTAIKCWRKHNSTTNMAVCMSPNAGAAGPLRAAYPVAGLMLVVLGAAPQQQLRTASAPAAEILFDMVHAGKGFEELLQQGGYD